MKIIKGNHNYKKNRVTAASELPEGTVILVQGQAYVDVYEDDYEQGEGRQVNTWTFDVSGQYTSAQELINKVADRSYCFSNNIDDYVILDGSLQTDAEVDVDNYPVDQTDIEAFKNGVVQWYAAHLYLKLMITSQPHEITDSEAEAFGFNIY